MAYTPSGLGTNTAEDLSRRQKAAYSSQEDQLKNGQLFWLGGGGSAKTLAQYVDGTIRIYKSEQPPELSDAERNSILQHSRTQFTAAESGTPVHQYWSWVNAGRQDLADDMLENLKWQGKTQEYWGNKSTEELMKQLDLAGQTPIDLTLTDAGQKNGVLRDVVMKLPQENISEIEQFKSGWISPTLPPEIQEMPDLTAAQRTQMVENLETMKKEEQVRVLASKDIKTLLEIPITDINFKDGLSQTQKDSITKLSKKPASEWNDTDKANWNYATNNQTLPGQRTTTTTTPTDINFKSGLSDQQKSGITDLSKKPVSQWTDTDKANWNYATNNQALPTQATAPTDIAFKEGLTPEQRAGINDLAKKPTAQWTDTDRANWNYATGGQPVPQISGVDTDTGTGAGGDTGTVDEPGSGGPNTVDTGGLTEEQKAAMKELNDAIDGWEGLDMNQKAILKEIASQDFTSGQKIPTTTELSQIIQDAATNAQADLDPYYQKTEMRELEDIRNSMEDIRSEASRYGKQEAIGYKEKLETTKQGLRARGMTFSGKSRALLGAETAIGAGGRGVEGAIPEARRIGYEGKVADYQERARDIGLAGERYLGSGKIGDLGGISTPYGSRQLYTPKKEGQVGYVSTGDLELDKLKETAKSKWERVEAYRANI